MWHYILLTFDGQRLIAAFYLYPSAWPESINRFKMAAIVRSDLDVPEKGMSHFNGLGALKAVLIIGTDYRKIDNTLYRYYTGRVTRTCIPTPVIRSRLTQ